MNKRKRSIIRWIADIMPDREWTDLILDFNRWFIEVNVVLVTSVLLGLTVYYILAQPAGLAGVFGRAMAVTCVNTGYCDYQSLLGAVGLSLVILTSFTTYFILTLKAGEDSDWEDEKAIPRHYVGRQKEMLEKIIGLKRVESLSGLSNFTGISYSTLYGWCEQFEEDGLVRVIRNGKGSPLVIESLI